MQRTLDRGFHFDSSHAPCVSYLLYQVLSACLVSHPVPKFCHHHPTSPITLACIENVAGRDRQPERARYHATPSFPVRRESWVTSGWLTACSTPQTAGTIRIGCCTPLAHLLVGMKKLFSSSFLFDGRWTQSADGEIPPLQLLEYFDLSWTSPSPVPVWKH